MFFTYPLQLFVFRDTFNHLFFGGVHLSTPVHSIITTLTVGSTMLVGCLVCDLGIILELTGGITGSMIALIIPCVCWIRVNAVRGEPLTIMQKIPYICCIIFGFVLMILSIIGQVIPVDPHKEPKNCNF